MQALTQESDEVQTLSISSVRLLLNYWLTNQSVPTCFPKSQSRRGKKRCSSASPSEASSFTPFFFCLRRCCEIEASLCFQSFEGGDKSSLRSAALLLFHPKQRVLFLLTWGTRCCGRVPGEQGCPRPPRVGNAGQGETTSLAVSGASAQPYLQQGKINGSQLSKVDYFIIIIIGTYN